jgi:hypothetical protein
MSTGAANYGPAVGGRHSASCECQTYDKQNKENETNNTTTMRALMSNPSIRWQQNTTIVLTQAQLQSGNKSC